MAPASNRRGSWKYDRDLDDSFSPFDGEYLNGPEDETSNILDDLDIKFSRPTRWEGTREHCDKMGPSMAQYVALAEEFQENIENKEGDNSSSSLSKHMQGWFTEIKSLKMTENASTDDFLVSILYGLMRNLEGDDDNAIFAKANSRVLTWKPLIREYLKSLSDEISFIICIEWICCRLQSIQHFKVLCPVSI